MFKYPLYIIICAHLCGFCQGFLIENKLLTLLAPLQRCEQTVMKLDAIFMVINTTFVCFHLPI